MSFQQQKKVSLPSCTSKRKREQEQERPTGHQGHYGRSRTTLTITYFHLKSFDISTFFCHHDSCTRVIARKQQRDTFDISFCLLSRFPSLLTTGMATAKVSFTDTQHNEWNSLITVGFAQTVCIVLAPIRYRNYANALTAQTHPKLCWMQFAWCSSSSHWVLWKSKPNLHRKKVYWLELNSHLAPG